MLLFHIIIFSHYNVINVQQKCCNFSFRGMFNERCIVSSSLPISHLPHGFGEPVKPCLRRWFERNALFILHTISMIASLTLVVAPRKPPLFTMKECIFYTKLLQPHPKHAAEDNKICRRVIFATDANVST